MVLTEPKAARAQLCRDVIPITWHGAGSIPSAGAQTTAPSACWIFRKRGCLAGCVYHWVEELQETDNNFFFFLHLCRFRPFYLETVPISHIHTDYEDGGNQLISQPQRGHGLLRQGRVLPNGKDFSYEFGGSVKKHPEGCRVGTAAVEPTRVRDVARVPPALRDVPGADSRISPSGDHWPRAEADRAEQSRAQPGRDEPSRDEAGRARQSQAGINRAGINRA